MGRTLKTRHLPQYKKDVLYPENLDIAAVNKNELPTSQEQNPRKNEKDIRGVVLDNNNDDLSCRSDFPCEQISTSNSAVVIPIVKKRKYPRHCRQIKVQKTNRHFGQEVCGVVRYGDGEDRSNEKTTKALAVMVPKKLRPTRQIENDDEDDDNTFYDGIKRRTRRNTRQTLKTNI